jgi:diacylglycerol kinase (ATP)
VLDYNAAVTAVAILNPRSGRGRAASTWARVRPHLPGRVDVYETHDAGHATILARDALRRGATTVIAIGGDGTVNEVLNGFFDGDHPIAPAARLGIVAHGTGSDFRRTLALPAPGVFLAGVLRDGPERLVDVMRVRYTTPDGSTAVRHAINVVGFGMGGRVAARAHESSRFLGGTAGFLAATIRTAVTFTAPVVSLDLDRCSTIEAAITNVAVGNGQFQGGGMRICPRARPDDGLLDVTVVDALSLGQLVRALPALYRGRFLTHPKVRIFRVTRLQATAHEPCLIEIDGEPVGRLPLEVMVVPRAVRVLTPPDHAS